MKLTLPNNIERDIQSRFFETGLLDMVLGICSNIINEYFS